MKPFTSFKLLYRGAKNARNPGDLSAPWPLRRNSNVQALCPLQERVGSAGEAAYSRERDMGQRGRFASSRETGHLPRAHELRIDSVTVSPPPRLRREVWALGAEPPA